MTLKLDFYLLSGVMEAFLTSQILDLLVHPVIILLLLSKEFQKNSSYRDLAILKIPYIETSYVLKIRSAAKTFLISEIFLVSRFYCIVNLSVQWTFLRQPIFLYISHSPYNELPQRQLSMQGTWADFWWTWGRWWAKSYCSHSYWEVQHAAKALTICPG